MKEIHIMQKWTGLSLSCFLLAITVNMATARDTKETQCTRLQQAGILSTAACSDPALRTAALRYSQVYYALKAQDTAKEYETVETQLAENNATLKRLCSLSPTGPETAHPSGKEKACFIRVRQKQTAALSHWLKGPYIQEANRPIALHIALQQKLIDEGYLSLSSSRADGIYDDHTRDAIRNWQDIHNDTQTGVITDDEISLLEKAKRPVTFLDDTETQRGNVSVPGSSQPLPNNKSPSLIRIFQTDMLGIERAYLEQITGPAKYVHQRADKITTRTYMVDDCEVTAYEDENIIDGYSLHVTPHCTIPMTAPGPHGEPPLTLADMTLEELDMGVADNSPGRSLVVGLCFTGSCGNNKTASLGFIAWGDNLNNYVNISASASVADTHGDRVEAAEKQWLSAMTDQAKQDYLKKGIVNCDQRYDKAGRHAMRGVPVQYFFFGNISSDLEEAMTNSKNVMCGDK